jgi:hypothetical protein
MGWPGGWPGGIMGSCCMLPSAAMATIWGGIMPWGPMGTLRPGGWGGAWGPAGGVASAVRVVVEFFWGGGGQQSRGVLMAQFVKAYRDIRQGHVVCGA